MSNLPQQDTIVQYLADGVTTMYIVPFFTPVETDGTPDLNVYTQLSTAPAIPESDINVPNVAYIYTPNLDPTTGGIITFQPSYIPPLDYVVTIARNVSASLDVEFSQASTFSGITLDAALDKLLLISQQNKSYAFDRNLSYIVNAYLPEATLASNVQIPVLQPGQIWYGSASGVIAATLEQSADTSTLRSELANNSPSTDGARLVGYYDPIGHDATTVDAQLTYLTGLAEAAVPTGTILDFGGLSAPSGFLACDGSAVSRSTYATLFAVIGVIWGAGDGSTTFNLPNLKDYATAGAGGSVLPFGNAVGLKGGAASYVLQANDLPPHTHPILTHTSTSNIAGGAVTYKAPFSPAADSTAVNITTNTAVSLIQPTAIVLKMIKT